MPELIKKLYHSLDLANNALYNVKLNPMSAADRLTLSLTTTDEGFVVYDKDDDKIYTWNGTTWLLTGYDTFVSLNDTPASYSGSAGKVLRVNSLETAVEFHALVKANVGLSNVDDTSDLNKPISTAVQTALNLKADQSITITATGNGITGGGSLAVNRTFALDFTYLDSRYAASGTYVNTFNGRSGTVSSQTGDYTTSIVAEGTNLYYTTVRFDTNFATKTTSDLTEGSRLYFTNARADARIAAAAGVSIAPLVSGLIPDSYLPSYVDDILSYVNFASFPVTGETGKIYVAEDTNKTYRWSGSSYVYITSGAVDTVNGGTGVVTITVTGTSNRISVAGGTGLTPTINISSSYIGQTSLTTLGTISTGIWQGTTISGIYIDNDTVIAKSLTGYTSGAGTITSADSILSAIQKLNGNISAIVTSFTLGSTLITSGNTYTTIAGLVSVTSTSFVGALTGNASTATALATGRTISITGDLSYTSSSFDGSGNITAVGTLASIITAGGPTGSASVVPVITWDTKGRLTAVTTATIIAGSVANALTVSTGLQLDSGTTFNGSVARTISIDSTVATLTGSQTLTNKSIVATQLTGTLQAAQFPALTGEATSSAGALAITLTNSAVIGKVLTGYVSGAGTVAATDTILQAIQKLNGNIGSGGSSYWSRSGTTLSPTTSGDDVLIVGTMAVGPDGAISTASPKNWIFMMNNQNMVVTNTAYAYYGQNNGMAFTTSTPSFNKYAIGHVQHCAIKSTNTGNWVGDGGIHPSVFVGIVAQTDFDAGATGTMTQSACFSAQGSHNASGFTITNWVGYFVRAIRTTGATTSNITNSYGLYISSDMATFGTTNWGIYNAATIPSWFGGTIYANLASTTTANVVYYDSTTKLFTYGAAAGGMTNPMTTAGDIIIGGASGTPTRLAAGTNTYVLTMTAGSPAWVALTGGGTVTSVSITTKDGVSGIVAAATTTPAISLTLGNIIPTIVTSQFYANRTISANVSGTWSTGTAGGTGRSGNILVVHNNKLYSLYGNNNVGSLLTTDIYDIAAGTWSTGTSATGSAHTSGVGILYDSKVYCWSGESASNNVLSIYDITANTWSTGLSGGTARFAQVGVLYNGKIYYWGGMNVSSVVINTLDIYDIASNTWSTGATGGTARLAAGAVLYNGKIYITGGTTTGANAGAVNTMDIYDISTNTWSTGTAGGIAKFGHTTNLYNGKIYSYAGNNASGTKINTLDIFDILTSTWSTGTTGGSTKYTQATVVYNGKLYSYGGYQNPNTYYNVLDIYDIGWRQDVFSAQGNGIDMFTIQTENKIFLNQGRLGIMGGSLGIGTSTPQSTLDIIGSFGSNYVAVTSTYSVLSTDYTVNATSGTFTVTLPTAVGIGKRIYVIKNSGTGVITLATTSSQTVDGSTTKTLNTQYSGFMIQSDGANWIIISTF